MEWANNLRTLQRGMALAARVAKARLESVPPVANKPRPNGRVVAFDGFGDNPGNLRMLAHLPQIAAGRPLVVLLHGCGQDAATFAIDSGWTALADRFGFPLILPQQAEANNSSRCFQWFHPSDITRGQGEAGSIAAMTQAAINRFGSNPQRVFIVGLSAGGAMAAALLAAYPDLFAAGAAVAGLPVGAARSGMQAILRMASASVDQSAADWAASVRAAAPASFRGPWPRLSIWQGLADRTVAPENATLLAEQWQALLDLDTREMSERRSGTVRHRFWSRGKQKLLEVWSLAEFTHAYPIGDRAARSDRFVQAAPVDATAAIGRFFGLD